MNNNENSIFKLDLFGCFGKKNTLGTQAIPRPDVKRMMI